ncbi:polysaccharide deacetylase family protein [Fusibacter ferrireducens]|uniref:Polysaccharide deacetylase family protein n=1 Tax=Fusibacter ferrireducens TaxID=2785058 RepID=A0ABR9ZS57_9FIRM|nr:polysaccharide deacetylase family protein [Fusibacter ferrireducens]MBF4692806.1 polysaccharide deacetylase family protein [Fusibacter ferrireducens]
MKSIGKFLVMIILAASILAGCAASTGLKVNSDEPIQAHSESDVTSPTETPTAPEGTENHIEDTEAEQTTQTAQTSQTDKTDWADATEAETVKTTANELDYQMIKPDESKEIMLIMYHNLGEKNTDYGRTVESFKQDLERLYDMGFRTLSMKDYIENNITTEAGYTPVVLTFDDGHISNFKYIEDDGKLVIDPDCVVGIMDEFSKTHPGFGRNAIFYLNYGNAFGQAEYLDQKITYLLENGYEIGNHTFSHEDLSTLNAEGIQTALGKNAALYHELNPEILMNTLALPYGKRPDDDNLRAYIDSGQYEHYNYENKAILAVGWKPDYPTYHVKHNYRYVYRVQSGDGEMQLTWWLDNYLKSPSKRFISDGDPGRISVPAKYSDQIDANKVGERELYFYELESN